MVDFFNANACKNHHAKTYLVDFLSVHRHANMSAITETTAIKNVPWGFKMGVKRMSKAGPRTLPSDPAVLLMPRMVDLCC